MVLWTMKLSMLISGAIIHTLICLGFVFCNQFPGPVQLKQPPANSPFISIRIVTRGLYPDLVRQNVQRNVQICHDAGFYNFVIEVVTDIPQNLSKTTDNNAQIREIIVPQSYRTKTGALYKVTRLVLSYKTCGRLPGSDAPASRTSPKPFVWLDKRARALQYCWEAGVNQLRDKDYVVHLDEETLLQDGSIRGILNFCSEGKYAIGHGAVTYGNGTVVNWFTTVVDNFRVAQDVALQFLFTYVHRPLITMKGSFLVTLAGAERRISFDFGPEGSITEDGYFAFVAHQKGYRFGHIEGEMWEQSAHTLMDFVRQNKRWFQGQYLLAFSTTGSQYILWRYRIIKILFQLGWISSALFWFFQTFGIADAPNSAMSIVLDAFYSAVYTYSLMFGGIRNFRHKFNGQPLRFILVFAGAYRYLRPMADTLKSIAVLWGLFTPKIGFYVIQKETNKKQSSENSQKKQI